MSNNSNMMAPRPFTLEGADIFMRNFTGKARPPYTPEGARNFLLRLPDELAKQLAEDGWNVSYLKPREDGDPETPALRVAVNFNYYNPPEVYKIIGRTKTLLSESNISTLDFAEIARDPETGRPMVDLRVRGRVWGDEKKGGIKAYLEKMYITVVEDDLDAKYNFTNEEDPF